MAFWVFGYGSLMWNPGFTPVETRRAVLKDYHRSFSMLSIHHRGTEEQPGLVLALDKAPGAQCTGVAFRIAETDEDTVLKDLRERELISSAYYEDTLPLACEDEQVIDALCYIINPDHRQYCHFDRETQAQMIARSVGDRGPNPDYLNNTVDHLTQMDIRDAEMTWLVQRVREITSIE